MGYREVREKNALMLGNQTRGVAEDAFAFLQFRSRRLPAVRNAAFEQFVRARAMIPDGDRRHDAESGEAEDKPAIVIGNKQLVTELILRDEVELRQGYVVRLHPREDLLERREFREVG